MEWIGVDRFFDRQDASCLTSQPKMKVSSFMLLPIHSSSRTGFLAPANPFEGTASVCSHRLDVRQSVESRYERGFGVGQREIVMRIEGRWPSCF